VHYEQTKKGPFYETPCICVAALHGSHIVQLTHTP